MYVFFFLLKFWLLKKKKRKKVYNQPKAPQLNQLFSQEKKTKLN